MPRCSRHMTFMKFREPCYSCASLTETAGMILQDWDVVNKCAMCCKMNVFAVTAYFEVHHVAVYCGLGSINYLVEIVDIFICICLYFWLTSSYASHQLPLLIMVALWNRADHYIFVLWFLSFFFYLSFFFPHLTQQPQIGCLPYFDTWYGLSATLECRSEMCCKPLAGNTGRKNDAKNRHLSTIAQLCRAISSQLRHISTIGKKTC